MCGIAGVISTKSMVKLNIYNLASHLRHRGPDNWGYYIESLLGENRASRKLLDTGYRWKPESGEHSRKRYRAYLDEPFIMMLHTRLSILDLSPAGNQPMEYNSGNLLMVFNGEIYNYLELKAQLQLQGYTFTTETDSEVLLAAYEEWEQECVHRFNGMWAFAIYDRIKQQLFISRDRLGVKPLFYTYSPETGYFAFASEIKALMDLPGVSTEVNRKVCLNYLLFDATENTRATFFKDIYRLEPGNNMVVRIGSLMGQGINCSKSITQSGFWELHANNDTSLVRDRDLELKKQEFIDLFTDAVRIRLRADVRVGTALSGGLDSSLNVYTINKLLKQGQARGIGDRQYSFSSVFTKDDEKHADESSFIDLITQKLDITSIKVTPSAERLREEIESLVYHQDEPFGSTSIFAQWCVFSLPRPNGVLVTLDGQGADEQLAGYLNYLGIYWSNLAIFDPRFLKEIWRARDISGGIRAGLRQFILSKIRKSGLHKINDIVLKRHMGRARAIFGEKASRSLAEAIECSTDIINAGSQTLNERLVHDTRNGLAVLLRYADRNSMAYGVESRTPYLDYRLVEYLAALPAAYKVHNGWTKFIARSAFDGKLPDKIVWRRDKMGFPTPEKNWLKAPLREWAINIIKESSILPELGVKANIINEYDKLSEDFSLWRLLNLELWSRVFKVNG